MYEIVEQDPIARERVQVQQGRGEQLFPGEAEVGNGRGIHRGEAEIDDPAGLVPDALVKHIRIWESLDVDHDGCRRRARSTAVRRADLRHPYLLPTR